MHAAVKSDAIIVRASAILPAGGAFDANPTAIDLGDYSEILIRILYARGGAAGSVIMFPTVSDTEKGTYYPLPLDNNTLVITGAPVGYTTIYQLQKLLAAPAANGNTAYSVTLSIKTSKWMKIAFAELGNTATPGTMQADCVLGSPQLA